MRSTHLPRPLRLLFICLALLTLFGASRASASRAGAQTPADGGTLWRDVTLADIRTRGTRYTVAQPARLLALDAAALGDLLRAAPAEATTPAAASALTLALPTPAGGLARFRVVNSPIMVPALAARYPQIQTYAGQGIDDPAATLRLSLTPHGVHAQVLTPAGRWYIDPLYHLQTTYYQSYRAADLVADPARSFVESFVLPHGGDDAHGGEDAHGGDDAHGSDAAPTRPGRAAAATAPTARAHGETLRVHRLAQAAAGEYTQFFGGSVADGMAAIVIAINRVSGLFERDVAIRLLLVEDNDRLVYTNPAGDPYSAGGDLNQQNQTTVDSVIGNANYDIGHVFHTDGGGYVSGLMGIAGQKARGNTGVGNPTGDPFWVDYVAHEMGHQYSASHTWNGNQGSCSPGQWVRTRALEPGSASTIMGYAGICGADNLQANSDAYFHATSIEQIRNHTTGGAPGDIGGQPTGNTPPTVSAPADTTIPARTPFMLTATGNDADGDALSYLWEQIDVPTAQRALTSPSSTAGPIFRSLNPSSSPTRYLPRMTQLLANATNATGNCPALPAGLACFSELLPTATRTLTFRATAFDNRANGGGVAHDDIVISVHNSGAPFRVTSANSATSWDGGSQQTITWDVADTTAAPIGCANVSLLFTTDGGQTWQTIVASTPNDGSAALTVPNLDTTTGRVMVKCASSIFFDLNDANLTVVGGPDFTVGATPATIETCLPADGGQYAISVGALAGFSGNVTLSAPDTPGTAQFAPPGGNAPFNSTLTITGAPPGVHPFDVIGSAGDAQRLATLTLDVAAAPALLSGLTPASGTLGVSGTPTLAWTPAANVTYRVQIATDPAFATLVADVANLGAATYTPTLAPETLYYWRARAENRCGVADWSATSAFRTGAPACSDVLVNGGFEAGPDQGWAEASSKGYEIIINDPFMARSGDWLALMGYDRNLSESVAQSVALPADALSADLTYYHLIDGGGSCTFEADSAALTLNGTPLDGHSYGLCSANTTANYVAADADLLAYAGQTVTLAFALQTDGGFSAGGWWVDDVALTVCRPAGVTPLDYGSLPAGYGVAWHAGDGALRLGANWDADDSFAPDHEAATDDGVTVGALVAGQPFNLDLVVTRNSGSADARVAVWFDWNGDGDFGDAGELAVDQAVATGNSRLTPTAPADVATGDIAYRVRLYDDAAARASSAPFGGAPAGEVTDGTVAVSSVPTAVTLTAGAADLTNLQALSNPGLLLVLLGAALLTWQRLRRRARDV